MFCCCCCLLVVICYCYGCCSCFCSFGFEGFCVVVVWCFFFWFFFFGGGGNVSDIAGAGIAQWVEQRTRDWKVADSNPCRRIFFPRVDFLCWFLFWHPFHPRVTAVARKRSRSFCQKRRWQVTAKHAYTLRMWLCMKWYGAWLYGVHKTCAETAAVSCGTSHANAVSTPLRRIFKRTHYKKHVTHVKPHVCWRELRIALYKRSLISQYVP